MENEAKKVIKDFASMVKTGEENVFDVVREVLLPKMEGENPGMKVTVALQNRELQPEAPRPPIRAESDARNHTFHDVNGFCDYLLQYGGPKSVVLANVSSQFVSATLSEPVEHGRETIGFQPKIHPLFVPWDNMAGKIHPISSLVENLMDNRRSVVYPDAKSLILILSQLRVKKDIDIQIGIGSDCINGVMVKTKIQGTENTVPVDLPDHLVVNAPIFIGTEPQDLTIDLTVLERDDKVWVKMSCSDLVVQKVKAFEAMLEIVRTRVVFDDGRPVIGMGVIGYQSWKYLKE